MAKSFVVRKVLALGVGVALIMGAWTLATREGEVHSPAQFADYYRANVSPLIDSASVREQQAVELALARLHEHFDYFRRGAPNFSRDLSQWSSRFGIAGRSISDLWTRVWDGGEQAVATRLYAEEKFRAWVINETSMKKALDDTLATFKEATDASRNRLEGEIKLVLGRPDSPLQMPVLQVEQAMKRATVAGRELSVQAGRDSAFAGGAGFVGGWIAGDAIFALTRAIVARVAVSGIAASAASGSATAGGAVAGGGGGSAAGPLGTAAGLIAGIVVGMVVDSFINDAMSAKITRQVTGFLDGLERELVEGTQGQPGLRVLLMKASKDGAENYRNALFTELQKAPLP